jgi:flagellar biosynthesis chaperone FliJ
VTTLSRLRQEYQKSQGILGYIMRPVSKRKKKKTQPNKNDLKGFKKAQINEVKKLIHNLEQKIQQRDISSEKKSQKSWK